jgi:hypothetical protein
MPINEKALVDGYQVVAPSMSFGIYRFAIRSYEAARAAMAEQPTVQEMVEAHYKEKGYTGLCSAHQNGENPGCKTCYPDQPVEFSTWAKRNFQDGCNLEFDNETGQYKNPFVQHAWFGWQGRGATKRESVEDGGEK